MSLLQAIIIAVVEGITEFLPISSTAHMKFANPLIGVQTNAFTDLYEIVIQLAAILADAARLPDLLTARRVVIEAQLLARRRDGRSK